MSSSSTQTDRGFSTWTTELNPMTATGFTDSSQCQFNDYAGYAKAFIELKYEIIFQISVGCLGCKMPCT